MRASIAIIELYQHDEVLRHYCELLGDSEYNIKIFCSKVVYESLEDLRTEHQFEWQVQKEGENIARFLKRNRAAFQACELVFITTALSDFKTFYQLSKVHKTILLVHNAHSFLAPEQHLFFERPIADRLRWLKLSFQQAHFYKRKMLDSLLALAFSTDRILDYVKKQFDLPKQLILLSLPFAYTKALNKTHANPQTITIPGTVVSELRDYESVYRAFLPLKANLKKQIQILLLGKPKEDVEEIVKLFHTLANEKIEIISFKHFISPLEYEAYLSATDFLVLPFKEFGRNHIYQEHLGQSKISGGINDMIRYGIPALIPEHYPLETALWMMSETYTNDTFSEQLKRWINEEIFTVKNARRKLLFDKYNKEKARADLLEKIEMVLGNTFPKLSKFRKR